MVLLFFGFDQLMVFARLEEPGLMFPRRINSIAAAIHKIIKNTISHQLVHFCSSCIITTSLLI